MSGYFGLFDANRMITIITHIILIVAIYALLAITVACAITEQHTASKNENDVRKCE